MDLQLMIAIASLCLALLTFLVRVFLEWPKFKTRIKESTSALEKFLLVMAFLSLTTSTFVFSKYFIIPRYFQENFQFNKAVRHVQLGAILMGFGISFGLIWGALKSTDEFPFPYPRPVSVFLSIVFLILSAYLFFDYLTFSK